MLSRLKWKTAQYFEALWWRGYLRNSHNGSYLTWKKEYWQKFLNHIAPHAPTDHQGKYLDLGCGPAGIFMILPGRVTAVDPLINQYRRDFPHLYKDMQGHVSFVAQKAEAFDAEAHYDSVFCLNVINHVHDLPEVMENIWRICKPGGKLVISVDVHRNKILHRIFRFLPLDILHPHQLSRDEFEALLVSRGFTIRFSKAIRQGWIFSYRVWVADKAPAHIRG